MTQDEIIRMAREAGFTDYYPERLKRFCQLAFAAGAAHERETYRLSKMTEEQIWKCNHDGDGGYHICVEHQNVVDFARAIEREIGFDRANMWLKRIKDAIAAEREACAKVCEEVNWYDRHEAAAAIRARGEK